MSGNSRRQWGWHRLDPRWAQRLVADSGVGPGDLVLDIGAGSGSITAPLIDAGAWVVAVEPHPGRAAALRARFGDWITVVETGAAELRLPSRSFHVVANPPFAITSVLLRRLLQPRSRLVSARLILDHRAALRWARPGAPGERQWRRKFEVDVGPQVPPHAFHPPPKVATCRVLTITTTRVPKGARVRPAPRWVPPALG